MTFRCSAGKRKENVKHPSRVIEAVATAVGETSKESLQEKIVSVSTISHNFDVPYSIA